MFLGFAVGGVVCSGATVAIDPMRRWRAKPADDTPPRPADEPVIAASTPTLDRAVALATGPIDELVANAMSFLSAMSRSERDDRLWVGWTRLAAQAVDTREPTRARLRRLLLAFSQNNRVASAHRPWLELIVRVR